MDISDIGADEDVDDLERFITEEEKLLLHVLGKNLPDQLYNKLQIMITRLVNELDNKDKTISSIYDDVSDILNKSRELFNKVDQNFIG